MHSCVHTIQTASLQDYVDVIRKTVKPTRGRELVVDVLTGVWDFKMYYMGLDVAITGLVSGPRHLQTIHSWRIVRRAVPWLRTAYCRTR